MGMLERQGYIHEAISPTGVTGDVRLAETLKLDNIIVVAKKFIDRRHSYHIKMDEDVF